LKEEKEKLPVEETKQSGEVTRRDFLVGSGTVIVGGAIGAGLLSSCKGGETVTTTVTSTKTVPTTVTAAATTVTNTVTSTVGGPGAATVTQTITKTIDGPGGAVLPAFEPEETTLKVGCSDGRALSAVDSKHGRIVRIRPHHWDWKYTEAELKPGKLVARGKTFKFTMKSLQSHYFATYKKRVYSPNRILYPLKRVDWEPGGGDVSRYNPQNRAKSKFKRVSWDYALNTVVSEIQRINSQYTPWAILTCMDIHGETKQIHGGFNGHGCGNRLLRQNFGGYTQQMRNPDSWEGWYWGAKHFWGDGWIGQCKQVGPLYSDIARNTDMVILWGHDPCTQTTCYFGAFPGLLYYWFQDCGIFLLHISPDLNFTGQSFNRFGKGKWLPVLANTDDALNLAVAYVWFTENTFDKDYLETHSVGWEKYRDYVLGNEDGIPKTPAWASDKCCVAEWTIKALAREWASKATSTAHREGGPMRGPYAADKARIEAYNMGLQGLGKPGQHSYATPHNSPRWVKTFSSSAANWSGGFRFAGWPGAEDEMIKQHISRCLVHQAILYGTPEKPVSWYGTSLLAAPVEDQFERYYYPIPADQGGSIIHMIWTDSPCNTGCWNNGFLTIKAWRQPQIETVVGQHIWLENDMLLCDIILPVCTKFENEDLRGVNDEFSFSFLVYEKPACPRIGESMSDMEIVAEMADILGTKSEFMNGRMTVAEWLQYGFEKSGAADLISFEEWKEKQYITAPAADDWQEDKAGLIDFYNNPASDPIRLPSGKLEYYSQRLAEHFPDDNERNPVAKYVIGGPGGSGEDEQGKHDVAADIIGWTHDESVEVELGAERCKRYPLVCQNNHPRWRFHVQFDDVPWLREIDSGKMTGYDGYQYESVWLHPETCAARGIKHGDIVKIYNNRGIVLAIAYMTEKVIPGNARIDHGARIDPIATDVENDIWIDRGGSPNLITPRNPVSKNCTGHCVSGYLVEVEKLEPSEMEEWRQKYPDAFARDYDPAYGVLFSAWIEKEEA
jgi:anaerobic selenocysteine-containing dehydrogenase